MKKFYLILVFGLISFIGSAQDVNYVFKEASELNLIGKLLPTPNPYHRVDTVKYKGFTEKENSQVRCSAGIAVLFKTNSSTISVKPEIVYTQFTTSTSGIATRGFDLYIKKDGKWLYAASQSVSVEKVTNTVLVSDMAEGEKECMLYLPMYSELRSVLVGVEEGATLEPLESPFRHRIGVFGSSFTQGIGITRAGMSWPMQLMRWTGLQFLNLGCSGNCKMQIYFADALRDADVDAFVFDAFSNMGVKYIKERLCPFIERIRAVQPDTPLIFLQTIRRENRNFRTALEARESNRQEVVSELMKEVCAKYNNVHFIPDTNAADSRQETSVDGIHPNDYGYTLWAESIHGPLLEILSKYGIN